MRETETAQVKNLSTDNEDVDHADLALQVKEMKYHASRHGYNLLYASPKDHKKVGGCEATVKLIKRFFAALPKEKWHILDIALLCKKISRILNSRPICLKGDSSLCLSDLNGAQNSMDTARCGTLVINPVQPSSPSKKSKKTWVSLTTTSMTSTRNYGI